MKLAAAATNLQQINLKSNKPPFKDEVAAIRDAMKAISHLRKKLERIHAASEGGK